jgi:hypothetical protein
VLAIAVLFELFCVEQKASTESATLVVTPKKKSNKLMMDFKFIVFDNS